MAISTAVDASAAARVVGIKTNFISFRQSNVLLLPQRVAVMGQGNDASIYSTDPLQVTSGSQAGSVYGFGSPIHLAVSQLLPANGDGVGTIPVTVYPLQPAGGSVEATGDITPAGAATSTEQYTIRINNITTQPFVIAVGDTVAQIVTKMTDAINGVLNMPVLAVDNTTDVILGAKWSGTSSNSLFIEVLGPSAGVTFGITQPVGGLVNPDVQPALDAIGNTWETMLLNCFEVADTTILEVIRAFGEGRWGPLVKKPLMAFTGHTDDLATVTAITDARKTDRINATLAAPGSNNLPFVVGGRELARIASRANNNPPQDYGSLQADGLIPGLDSEQWTYPERDEAVKKGASTVETRNGVVTLGDIVTMYHPEGEEPPAYRYVVDIVKLQNLIFNLNLIFESPEWDGAPLLPDNQPTSNRSAKKPKNAVAAVASMLDGFGLEAMISDPATAKANIVAEIDSQNPKRLNILVPVQLSGNINIVSIDLNFGFFFGAQ